MLITSSTSNNYYYNKTRLYLSLIRAQIYRLVTEEESKPDVSTEKSVFAHTENFLFPDKTYYKPKAKIMAMQEVRAFYVLGQLSEGEAHWSFEEVAPTYTKRWDAIRKNAGSVAGWNFVRLVCLICIQVPKRSRYVLLLGMKRDV